MYLVKVDVTLNDIQCGTVGNTRRCPIALAMLRAMEAIEPHRFEVVVGGSLFGIYDKQKDVILEYETPAIGQFFIVAYDDNRPVGPFNFDFDLHSGRPSNRLHGSFQVPIQYIKSSVWDMNYGFDYSKLVKKPIKYEKIIPLVKDIQTVKEVKEPTTAELMEFINKSELSFDHQLVKV